MASNYATGAALATAQNQWPTFFCRHLSESIDKVPISESIDKVPIGQYY
jgi:hypothetical protein